MNMCIDVLKDSNSYNTLISMFVSGKKGFLQFVYVIPTEKKKCNFDT